MGDRSAIEWCDASWNPIRGTKGMWTCTKVSPGCQFCYAERLNMSKRHGSGPAYVIGADTARLDEAILTQPLRWNRPRKIFPCSMTDLFGEHVHDLWIGRIFGTMSEAYWHTFQVLTKRAERLYEWSKAVMHYPKGDRSQRPVPGWPPNVILMVSAEDQQRLDERLPWLLRTNAALFGVSLEPLLGPIDATRYLRAECHRHSEIVWERDWKTHQRCQECGQKWDRPGLGWAIVGGESGGPLERALVHHTGIAKSTGDWLYAWGPKPEALEWVRSLRDQCVAAGVALHFKQWGGPTAKSGGRLLDGRTWDEFPNAKG